MAQPVINSCTLLLLEVMLPVPLRFCASCMSMQAASDPFPVCSVLQDVEVSPADLFGLARARMAAWRDAHKGAEDFEVPQLSGRQCVIRSMSCASYCDFSTILRLCGHVCVVCHSSQHACLQMLLRLDQHG